MVDPQPVRRFDGPVGSHVREVLDSLERLVLDGLKHGFFEYSITCEIGVGGKRAVVICAGKSHKFTIPGDQFPL
jgi:hypothetical protein